MTIYLFKTSVLIDLLKSNAKENSHEFGRDILPKLVKNKKLFGYKFNEPWYYARTIKSYYKAHMALLDRKFDLNAWQIRTNMVERNELGDRVPARINGDVKNSVISEGCVIHGSVINSVLSPGVNVEKGAVVRDSIVLHDSLIQANAALNQVICDKDVIVSEDAEIGGLGAEVPSREYGELLADGFTLIGRGVNIPARTRIAANTAIYSTVRSIANNIPAGSTLK